MNVVEKTLRAEIPDWLHQKTSKKPFPILSIGVDDKKVIILLSAPPRPVYIELPENVGIDLTFGALLGRRLYVPPQPVTFKVFMHGVPYLYNTPTGHDGSTHVQPLRPEDLLRGYIATNFDFWGESGIKVETPQHGRVLHPLSDLCDHDLDGDADMTPMSSPEGTERRRVSIEVDNILVSDSVTCDVSGRMTSWIT